MRRFIWRLRCTIAQMCDPYHPGLRQAWLESAHIHDICVAAAQKYGHPILSPELAAWTYGE